MDKGRAGDAGSAEETGGIGSEDESPKGGSTAKAAAASARRACTAPENPTGSSGKGGCSINATGALAGITTGTAAGCAAATEGSEIATVCRVAGGGRGGGISEAPDGRREEAEAVPEAPAPTGRKDAPPETPAEADATGGAGTGKGGASGDCFSG